MKKMVSLFLALVLCLGLAAPAFAADSFFADVPTDAWYAEAVNAMAKGGLVNGKGDGLFHPDDTITYGEFAAILARLYGYGNTLISTVGTKTTYSAYGWRIAAVYPDDFYHWSAPYIWEMNTKILDKHAICQPEDYDLNVIRASALEWTVLARENAGLDMTEVTAYTEADIPDWEAVQGETWTSRPKNGGNTYGRLIIGEMNFLPEKYVTKSWSSNDYGYRYNEIAEDNPEGLTWVRAWPDYTLKAYNLGITNGVDADGTCAPLRSLTRAELCAMLYRAGLTRAGMCKAASKQ